MRSSGPDRHRDLRGVRPWPAIGAWSAGCKRGSLLRAMAIPARIALCVAAAVALGAGAAPGGAQPAPAGGGRRWTAVRAGRLFDGKSTSLATSQVILIDGDRIAAVG